MGKFIVDATQILEQKKEINHKHYFIKEKNKVLWDSADMVPCFLQEILRYSYYFYQNI